MDLWLLLLLASGVAALYSLVGHGGASGYLAVMALAGMAPSHMKPTALMLNVLVAGLGTWRYVRAGCFRWNAFWPFAVASIPAAFAGGAVVATGDWYRKVLGVLLVITAVALLIPRPAETAHKNMPLWAGLVSGGVIGFLSGLIGIGGGIFLSPLLILAGWASTRETLGISALFILVNSYAGLLPQLRTLQQLPFELLFLAPAAFVGGLIGTELGARRLPPVWVRYALSAVLVIAGVKLLLT